MDSNIGYLSGRECFYELVGNEAATLRFASLCQHNTDALCDHPRRREKNHGSDVLVRRFAGSDLMKNKAGLNLSAVGDCPGTAAWLKNFYLGQFEKSAMLLRLRRSRYLDLKGSKTGLGNGIQRLKKSAERA